MLLAEEVINSTTGVAVGVVVTIVIAAVAWATERASTRHRLKSLEDAQEKDNEWRSKEFAPWRRKIDNFTNSIKLIDLIRGLSKDPDAAESRGTWPRTDDH